MRIWFISDTHSKHGFLDIPLEGVDMVIFAGDATIQKHLEANELEMKEFLEWFASLPYKYKIMIGGNHDTALEKILTRGSIPEGIIYLEHEFIEIGGLKIFGSPYTPKFKTDWAFNVPRGQLSPYWKDIPEGLDILITHGPPKGILDLTQYNSRTGADGTYYFQCGCKELLERIKIVRPRYHVFGHIHPEKNCPNSGILNINNCPTTFINAAVCDFGRDDEERKIKQLINNGFILEV